VELGRTIVRELPDEDALHFGNDGLVCGLDGFPPAEELSSLMTLTFGNVTSEVSLELENRGNSQPDRFNPDSPSGA
jgi:hypothetical protein